MRFFTTLMTYIYILLSNISTSYAIHKNSDDDLFLTLYGTPMCHENKESVTIELRNNCDTIFKQNNVQCGTQFYIFRERFPKATLLEDISVRFTYNEYPKKYVFKHIVSDCSNDVDFEGKGYHREDNEISCILENIN
uniref:ZP domain-containing protein n=1 Tax=Strongyloides papillosus TaxID=174720 RepID=A0A0N5CC55_STREA